MKIVQKTKKRKSPDCPNFWQIGQKSLDVSTQKWHRPLRRESLGARYRSQTFARPSLQYCWSLHIMVKTIFIRQFLSFLFLRWSVENSIWTIFWLIIIRTTARFPIFAICNENFFFQNENIVRKIASLFYEVFWRYNMCIGIQL